MALRRPTESERAFLCAASGLLARAPTSREATPRDWSFLLQQARRGFVHAKVAASIVEHHAAECPPETLASIADTATHNEVQNRILLLDLAKTASLLRARGIESIAIKGAALLPRYPSLLAHRHTDDIDLWVDPRHIEEADRVLRAAGYRPLVKHDAPVTTYVEHDGRLRVDPQAHDGHELAALVSPSGTPIELHRSLPTPVPTLSWTEACARADRIELHGVSLMIRDRARTLIDICAHIVLHHVALPLLWPRHLLDVAALVEDRPSTLDDALAIAHPIERATIVLTRLVRDDLLHRSVGGALAESLVFPSDRAFGWGWFRLGREVLDRARRGPASLLGALLPSSTYLRAAGYLQDGGVPRAHLRRARHLVVRAMQGEFSIPGIDHFEAHERASSDTSSRTEQHR